MGSDVSRKASRILTALVGWLVTTGAAIAAPYKVAEFHSSATYLGLNDRGQVFGRQDSGPSDREFVFDSLGSRQYTILDRPTAAGTVSGTSQDLFVATPAQGRPAVYNVATGQSALLDIPWPYTKGVRASDDSGRLYGQAWHAVDVSVPHYRPFVVENGEVRELDLPPGMGQATLAGVNAAGEVLIEAGPLGQSASEAYLMRGGEWVHLGSFRPVGLNDRGDVVGNAWPAGDGGAAGLILVPADGSGPVALGGLPGALHTFLNGINSRGDIVGTANFDDVGIAGSAFIYRDGVATDLNTLIDRTGRYGELDARMVAAINDLGQILVRGTDGGHWVDLLLSPSDLDAAEGVFVAPPPVPEPSTLLVFAGLALGVGLARRRRRG